MSISKKSFIEESNPYLANKSPFSEKNRSIIYVEGYDDLLFYNGFLEFYFSNILRKPNIYCGNSKKGVLKCMKNTQNDKNKYIVDSDYDSKQELIDKGIIVTTGYSMENFYFYIDENGDNLTKILELVYDKLSNKSVSFDYFYNSFINDLNIYYEKNLLFFAYMKTLHSMGFEWSQSVKELFDNNNDYSKEIDNELNALNDFQKELMKMQIENNIKELKESKFMLIRGHNIFDFMVDYFNKQECINKNVDIKKFILNNSGILYVPDEFSKQFLKGE